MEYVTQWELYVPVLLLNEVVHIISSEDFGPENWRNDVRDWWAETPGSFQEKAELAHVW